MELKLPVFKVLKDLVPKGFNSQNNLLFRILGEGQKSKKRSHYDQRILYNQNVHYSAHKGPTVVPVLSQINPLHTTPFYFYNVHLNISFPPTSMSA
jgi:hypothetical protein